MPKKFKLLVSIDVISQKSLYLNLRLELIIAKIILSIYKKLKT